MVDFAAGTTLPPLREDIGGEVAPPHPPCISQSRRNRLARFGEVGEVDQRRAASSASQSSEDDAATSCSRCPGGGR